MTEIKIHWSFWLICIVAMIWNLMGSINFIMQMNPDMLANYPEDAQSLIISRPLWATGAFAVAVFGGVFGEIFLLLRKSSAYYIFIASFLGVIAANIHTFNVSSSVDIWFGSLMSLIVAAFLIYYTKLVKRKGWVS